jgi:hypothetical protein
MPNEDWCNAQEPLPTAGEAKAERGRRFGDRLRQKALSEVDRQKDDMADGLNAVAGRVRGAAEDLSAGDRSMAARLAREAADGLEGLSRSLHDRSVADTADEVRSFGRRHPFLFVAGGLLAGVALARFVKASGEREEDYEAAAWRSGRAGPGDAGLADDDLEDFDVMAQTDGSTSVLGADDQR